MEYCSSEDLTNLLHDTAIDLLHEYGEDENIEMPDELEEADSKDFSETITQWLSSYKFGNIARALVVLYREDNLLEYLEKQMLTPDDVCQIVVEFYSDILDD